MKEYRSREFEKILRMNGYSYERCKGDHATYKNAVGKTITINLVRFKPIVAQRLIKEHSLMVTCR